MVLVSFCSSLKPNNSTVSFQGISWSSISTDLSYSSFSSRRKPSPGKFGYVKHVMQCAKCNRTFSNNTALERHIYSKHEDPDTKRLACHLCPKKFNSQASLTRHIKMHQGVYAHRCKYCQKGFVTKDHLQGHISSNHTGERPFACKQCGKSFLYRSHLLAHQKKDHRETS